MAFTKYDDTLSIPKFLGINQCNDGHNQSLGYAVSGMNFDTSYGGLKPFHSAYNIPATEGAKIDTTLPLDLANGDGALTLGFMTKRWQMNAGVIGRADSYENVYMIAVVDGRLYYRRKSQNTFDGAAWTEIKHPDTGNSFAFNSSKFDWVTYEINYLPPVQISASIISAIYKGDATYFTFDIDDYAYYEVHTDDGVNAYYTDRHDEKHELTVSAKVRISSDDAPIDCLLMTNSEDGMWCIYVPLDTTELKVSYVPVQPYGTTQDIKFGTLARYAERIWGAAITTDPDKLMYSAPYDLFNWEQFNDQPDDGAGDIQQPNWDGDQFVAIKQFGSSLLAIKENAVWRITGTTPSELNMRKQYGEGTIAEDSFAINGSYAYMLTDDDIKAYDGSSTYHMKYGYIKDVLIDVDYTGKKRFIGRMVQDRYVLQVPHHVYGSLFVIYNAVEGTFNLCKSNDATALEVLDGELYGLYPEDVYDDDGNVTGTYVQFGKFLSDEGEQLEVDWVSTWNDLSYKNVVKSGFIMYLMFDRINAPANATITPIITLYNEKKAKTKTVKMTYSKVKRIRLNASGRQFKIQITVPAQPYEWKISTGIQLYVEYDAD